MRFFLDHDVDASCRGAIRGLGHEAWTAGEAGRAVADDSEQLIYAQGRDAVLITQDKQLLTSRQKMPIAKLIRLECKEWDAPALLTAILPKLIELLEHNENIYIEISASGLVLGLEENGDKSAGRAVCERE